MISHTTERFRKALKKLPTQIQQQAREAYKQFLQNPYHPDLHFKLVHAIEPIYSVRIGLHYRAVGVQAGDEMLWFWIGIHSEYERLLASL